MRRIWTRIGPAAFVGAALFAVLLPACVLHQRPVVTPPPDGQAAVLVASGLMPPPIDDVARHAWLSVRRRGQAGWSNFELWGSTGETPLPDPLFDHGGGGVMIHAVFFGEEAERYIACLERETPGWDGDHDYIPLPGPNSNTYVEAMLRRCGIPATLPATAIGRDHRGLAGASVTSEGTGVQIETPIVGAKLGLKEGVEIHLASFALGLDLWPPAIIVPLGPGRLGFDDR